MTTYSEAKKRKPFDWFKALNAEYPDWHRLKNIAASWVTCACGNQCERIPRNEGGAPDDIVLYDLGTKFSQAIEYEQRPLAIQILNEIEKRSVHIINEIKNQNNEHN
jgi:hypothetical protein